MRHHLCLIVWSSRSSSLLLLLFGFAEYASAFSTNHRARVDARATRRSNQPERVLGDGVVVDNPCWGSESNCSLSHLLSLISKESAILLESDDYLVLDKPADLRMDGDYPATVHKLLTYWYPPKSMIKKPPDLAVVATLAKFNDIKDNQLRPCHQLDYATSGVLLLGRTRQAAAKACRAFEERTTCQKTYLALVHSHLQVQLFPTLSSTCSRDNVMEHVLFYDQQQANKQKQSKKQPEGYLPPHVMFLKYKSYHERGGTSKRAGDAKILHLMKEKIENQKLDAVSNVSWAEVKKNKEMHGVFVSAAKVYYQAVLQEAKNTTEQEIDKTKPMIELPTVFRLEQDSDASVFYVSASLARQANDFAMKIHPSAGSGAVDPTLDFKHAVTRCTVLQYATIGGAPVTKLKLEPMTGRRHQLRCHMALLGTPIAGDATYTEIEAPNVVSRMCLHAFRLSIDEVVHVQASDPFLYNEETKEFDISVL